jgi:organic radical activating enzyme
MSYKVNEIFWSPQGEGMRAGQMSVFIRLTGCNLRCSRDQSDKSPGGFDCDTEFVSGTWMDKEQIVFAAMSLVNQPESWWEENKPWVVFTGGEPSLQLDPELVEALHQKNFLCAIETNGSNSVDHLNLDWITVSPKVAEHCVRQKTADEVKYVRGYGQGIPVPSCTAKHQLISPAFSGGNIDKDALQWCLKLIKENPQWRLSVQQHKTWQVR